jgi:hypothetical protein
MPRVETREAAAPATSAAEKFRLVIIMVLILCVGGAKSTAKGLPAEMLGDWVSRDVVVAGTHFVRSVGAKCILLAF